MSDQFDVIVCGAGTAGQPAATFASRRGAKVLLVDLAPHLGGNTQRSTGQMSAAGTRLQAEKGIHDSPDKHFDDIMRISHGTADSGIVRLAVDNAADTLHWLLDNGLELLSEMPVIFKGHEPYSIARTYWGPDGGGRPLQKILGAEVNKEIEGGNISLMLETEVIGLIQQDSGTIAGVIVRTKEGEEKEFHAKNILLSMGGCASNEEKFLEYAGYPLWKGGGVFGSHPFANGKGHELGLQAGGYIRYQDSFLPTFARVKDPDHPEYCSNVTNISNTSLFGPRRDIWEIFVNWEGERFVCEDSESPDERENALITIPDLTFWAVYDQGIREAAPASFFTQMSYAEADPLFNVHESFKKSDSLAELATAMGIHPDGLENTVERYNNFVEVGEDSDFNRSSLPAKIGTEPFYGVKHHGLSITSFAGLAVNEGLQVIREDGTAISGLYAAGETLGLGVTSGKAFCGGMALTPGMTFGRLLGQELWQW